MKKITALNLLLISMILAGLYGCNTVQGVGEDVQVAGEKLEDSAD